MKTKLLKLLAVMTISITALFALGITASAATAGDFTITLTEGGGDPVVDTDYTYAEFPYAPGVLTIKSSAAMTISGTTTTGRIVVADDVSANITLNGVNIDTSNASGAAFVIADNSTGNVTITLADGTTNTLKSVVNCAGLQKNGEYSETLGKLTITGTGTLTATGGDKGAGIGGGGGGSSSNIEISGGKVTATGGGYGAGTGGDFGGAGIGGGKNGSGSNIEISGGTVKAQGGYRAAGIGGGGGGSSSNIEISGGTVTATGGSGGAGIGGGWICSSSDIKISGGVVTATGGESGAGIGGGFEGNGSNITISGGVVIANGGGGSNGGAGIGGGGSGGGSYGSGSNITINGGTVTATGNSNGADIGGGGGGSSSNIKISGGSVKADTIGCTPTDGTANVTPVYPLEFDVDGTSAVTINGKAYPTKHIDENWLYVYLPAGNYTVANGNSQKLYTIADDGTVSEVVDGTAAFTITGTGLVYGTDYTYENGVLTINTSTALTIKNTNPSTPTTDRIEVATGISANITLAGVNIDVSGTEYAAAFKIADNSTGNVTITLADGKTNTLKSGTNCAGLQKNGEYSETLGKLTITGTGTLTATGGESGAGIGGGFEGNSSNIEISGGKVTATGGDYGAGIGSGGSGSGSYITISGGEVTARGGEEAAGIGGGFKGNGSNIEISGGEVTATGDYGAGIGGGFEGSGSNIEISGGEVTATGGDYGAGIGGGAVGGADNITISGGSVKAVAGEEFEDEGTTYFPAAIGQGVQCDSNTGVFSNGAEVTPTDGTDNVYLLELDVDGTSAVTINGKAYPTKHIDENKLYVYLPAGNYTVVNGNSQKLYTIADDGTVSEVNAEDTCTCTAKCTEENKNTECPVCSVDHNACEYYIPTSGNCGAEGNEENVIWNFDTATGTLTISGTGAMADYDIFYRYPVWSQFYRESIKKIVIGYGVTRIGTDAFYDCLNAEEVVFERNENGESSVTSIGNYAFWTIDELNNIVVPASVETIGDNVFRSCNSLTIVFEEGSSLGTIGNYSFHNIKNSEECIIPSKVTSIGERAFRDNEDLKHFYYPAGVNFGTSVFYEDSLLEYFGEYTVNENDKTCSISYIGVGQNEYDYYPDENAEITASEIVIPEKIDGYKVVSVKIGESTITVPENISVKNTVTKLSDVTALNGWTYDAGTDELTAGGLVNVTLRSYKISDTQKFTITSKTVTVSRAVCVDEDKNHSCDLCGAVISGCEEYMSDWSSAETEHQRTCTYCGKIESAPHTSSGAATPNKAETCTVCGYEITPATGYVSAPTFTPVSGTTFTSTQNVTIACATDGATIYYTTDGSTPTTASAKYTGAITITSTTTIKAIAVKDGMGDSSVVTAKYTKNSGGSGGSGGGSGGGGYRPPVVPDNDDVVVNDPEDNEDKSDNGNGPQIKGDNGKTGWDAILDELDDADEGDKIVVDMNGETEVPEDVFEQIKGQDIDLVIELDNGFIWTINGKDVTNPADIDLGVNKGSTIPVRVINAVTGECEYITITLTHNGEFGFKAVLTVDMGVKNEGYFANLYWYTDNDTKFICADKIDNKGRANLVFTHASEYVIVIDENDHTPEDDVSAGAGIEEDSSEIPDDFDNDENPYTGVAISFAGIIISAATIVVLRKRKQNR